MQALAPLVSAWLLFENAGNCPSNDLKVLFFSNHLTKYREIMKLKFVQV